MVIGKKKVKHKKIKFESSKIGSCYVKTQMTYIFSSLSKFLFTKKIIRITAGSHFGGPAGAAPAPVLRLDRNFLSIGERVPLG